MECKKRCLKAKSVEVRIELSISFVMENKIFLLDLKSKVSSLDFEIKFEELQLTTKLELFLQSTNKDNQDP